MVTRSGVASGLTTRKPTIPPSVRYHKLLGFWGSWRFHSGELACRAAERNLSGSSSQDPPRTTWGALGLIKIGSVRDFVSEYD